jgi:hypothetical protein
VGPTIATRLGFSGNGMGFLSVSHSAVYNDDGWVVPSRGRLQGRAFLASGQA